MLQKIKWKTVITVLVVVIAGIVYCVFFTKENDSTVQYQTDNTADEEISHVKVPEKTGADKEMLTDNTVVGQSDGSGAELRQNVGVTLPEEADLIFVHVCGAVKKPGVYAVSKGARVCDAITMSGGLTEKAADDYVNQARSLTDGERVYIPKRDELGDLSVSQYAAGQQVTYTGNSQSNGTKESKEQQPVNINTATLSELTTLPGIGESRAESIIAYRETHGPFSKIVDIMKINGIKDAAYEKIKDRICTGNE